MLISKLAWGNVRRSTRDYTIYTFILGISVAIFYVFNSFGAQVEVFKNSGITQIAAVLEGVDQISKFMMVLIDAIFCALIVYANAYLVRLRKREFGTYLILGMPKIDVALILLLETVFFGLAVIIVGLFAGVLVSQFLATLTAYFFRVQITQFSFVFSASAAISTIVSFAVIFILSLFFNTILIGRARVIELLHAERKVEKHARNAWVSLIVLAISVVIIAISYKMLMGYGLLNMGGAEFRNATILVTIGTVLFFFAGVSGLVLLLSKTSWSKRALNTVLIRQIASRVNSGWISISFVCALLFLSLSAITVGFTLTYTYTNIYQEFAPVDATVEIFSDGDTLPQDVPHDLYPHFQQAFPKAADLVKDHAQMALYMATDLSVEEFLQQTGASALTDDMINLYSLEDRPLMIASVQEFNRMTSYTKDPQTITLAPGEAYLITYMSSVINKDSFARAPKTIMVGDKNYTISQEHLSTSYIASSNAYSSAFALLLVNENELPQSGINLSELIMNMKLKDGSTETGVAFDNAINEVAKDRAIKIYTNPLNEKNSYSFMHASTAAANTMQLFTTQFTLAYLAIYAAAVLTLCALAILALQSLSAINDSALRFQTLRDIGVDTKQLIRLVHKQIAFYFALPIVLALSHTTCVLVTLRSSMESIGNFPTLAQDLVHISAVTVVIYLAFVLLAYIMTCVGAHASLSRRISRSE